LGGATLKIQSKKHEHHRVHVLNKISNIGSTKVTQHLLGGPGPYGARRTWWGWTRCSVLEWFRGTNSTLKQNRIPKHSRRTASLTL